MKYPYIEIEPDKVSPVKSSIFYDPILKHYVLVSNYKGKDKYIYEKNLKGIYKLLDNSYDDINLLFNYPTTWSDKSKARLLPFIGNTTSNKKRKTNFQLLLLLLKLS